MYAKVTTSLAALMVIVPAMTLMAPALAADHSQAGTLQATAAFGRANAGDSASPDESTQRLAHRTRRVDRLTRHTNRERRPGAARGLPRGPNIDQNKPGKHGSVADQVKRLKEANNQAPIPGHCTSKLKAEGKCNILSICTKKMKAEGKCGGVVASPTPVLHCTSKLKAEGKCNILSICTKKMKAEGKCGNGVAASPTPGPAKPDNGTADDRPKRKVIIVIPGQSDTRGDEGGNRGDRYAPGVAEPAPRYYAPRYQAQPQVQPQPVVAKDDPTCVQGTWAMLGDEKKYVCLSWHFRGQLYTTDQLEQVLEALGMTRPAYNGN